MNSWKSVESLARPLITSSYGKERSAELMRSVSLISMMAALQATSFDPSSFLRRKELFQSLVKSKAYSEHTYSTPLSDMQQSWKESSIPWPAMKPAYGTSYPSLTGPSHPVLPGEILSLPSWGNQKPSFEGLSGLSSPQTTMPQVRPPQTRSPAESAAIAFTDRYILRDAKTPTMSSLSGATTLSESSWKALKPKTFPG